MKLGLNESQRWPAAIIVILAAQVAFGIWMAKVANADPHFAVEPDYYKRAVAWDTTMAQARRDHALGWAASATITADAGDSARLHVTLTDSAGAPITADSVEAEAFSIANSARQLQVTLRPAANGYATTLPAARRGLWEVHLRAARGHDHFTAKLRPEYK